MREQTAKERDRLWRGGLVAECNNEQRALLLRRQLEMIGRRACRKPRWTRIELKRRAARFSVEPDIFQQDVGRTERFAGSYATARAALASHLKQIGEVVVEQQRQIEACRIFTVILQANALIGRSAPQEDRAHDVQHVLRQHDPSLAID